VARQQAAQLAFAEQQGQPEEVQEVELFAEPQAQRVAMQEWAV
jgi:hypothetical protein